MILCYLDETPFLSPPWQSPHLQNQVLHMHQQAFIVHCASWHLLSWGSWSNNYTNKYMVTSGMTAVKYSKYPTYE